VARRARHLTAVSSHVAEHFRRYLRYRYPIYVVPNAIAPETFVLGKQRLSHPHSGPFTVASVLTGWKGLKNGPVALEAFGILQKAIPDARLLLIGHDYAPGGPAEMWARRRSLTAGVEFIGPLPNGSVLRRLADETDVLLHPSLEEAFGMTVAEAMALGLPVVGGKASGAVPSLLEDGRAGDLVEIKSPASVAQALERLARNSALRQQRGLTAFQSAYQRFRDDVVLDQYERIYEGILDGSLSKQETSAGTIR
jgi:glycosyltransferase involved in cell wall biosynthesis